MTKSSLLMFLITLLCGCAVTPKNLDDQRSDTNNHFIRKADLDLAVHSELNQIGYSELFSDNNSDLYTPKFSRGDTVKIRFHAMPNYNGIYKINSQGYIELPFTQGIRVDVLTRKGMVKKIQQTLKQKNWFQNADALIDVSLVESASINVAVFGAVFKQGRVTINSKPRLKAENQIQHQSGAFSAERNLITAIAAAGGIRPDADLQRVFVKRNNVFHQLNLMPIIDGRHFSKTPSLVNGDQIFVASSGNENSKLIRPSQITPPGMRVLMSNLTAPALSNAQSAVGADATRLPYGSSLLDAALSANCVGGTHQANASRTIILITKHHGSKQQLVVKRSINQLLAKSSDYANNPYLMPNDGVACYDSKFTNVRDVARGIGELFGPILLGGLL